MKRNQIIAMLIMIVPSLLSIVVGCFIERALSIETNISINMGLFIGILLFFILALILVILKYNKIEKQKDKLKRQFNPPIQNDGDKYFYMALTQPFYTSLRMSLLEKSAKEYKHPLAAVFLANIYEFGLEHDGRMLYEINLDEAIKYYKIATENDNIGVSDWCLGWIYERREHYQDAYNCYQASEFKKFPKAYNSIGKFHQYNLGNVTGKKDRLIARQKYQIAMENNDIFGTLNCGHAYRQEYRETNEIENIKTAEKCYILAQQQRNVEGPLCLGEIYEEAPDVFRKTPKQIAQCYLTAISLSRENTQYLAAAFFKLGNLIFSNPSLKNDTEIIDNLSYIDIRDPGVACYMQSYTIFQNIIENNNVLTASFRLYFDTLKEKFGSVVENRT